ncbi:FtsX-like permease family protein [Catellatospora chokoriensis]|uniref:ABC3 transporter permease C-terminal domain-containing protein n=1 Tax=Catellatospora chokoriensis TaxID=310353 RepID=A0A8J3NP32_9ACTN|nr:FtsX-like permease family protein [Catellatospora chokoriensis]GIF86758.1 hypothetical protein Cch02nite_02020 [Catellatospora chokoriensis]
MTALLWEMIRERRAAALITFLLTLASTAAAAGGPIYHAAAAQSLRLDQIAQAPVTERVLTASQPTRADETAESRPASLPYVAHMSTVYGVQVQGTAGGGDRATDAVLASRTGVCRVLVLTAGRCAVADREAVLPDGTPELLGTRLGGVLTFSTLGSPEPVRFTVVGVYRRPDAADAYWADRVNLLGVEQPVLFATDRSLEGFGGQATVTVDLVAQPAAFADTAELAGQIEQAQQQLTAGGYVGSTLMTDLSKRIDQGDRMLADTVTIAAVPLILICWFVLFLAVAAGVDQRREELGLAALRGTPARLRWALPFAEVAVPVLAAAVPGLFAGYALTAALVRTVLPGSTVQWDGASLRYAAFAVLGALLAGVFAQVGALRTPVLGLLRRSGGPRRGRFATALEVGAGSLAAVAGYQAAAAGDAGGIGLLAPACLGLACGLLAARLLPVAAARVARAALRRGRWRTGLAGFALARVPGTGRLVVLVTVVFGLLGFAVTAYDTAGRAWDERAQVQTGAARVVKVDGASAVQLRSAVAAVDPDGQFAMAVSRYKSNQMQNIVAADTTRLARVANWPDSAGLAPGAVAGLLRPAQPTAIVVKAKKLVVDVTVESPDPQLSLQLRLLVISDRGLRHDLRMSGVRPGFQRVELDASLCDPEPCRLDEIQLQNMRPDQHRFDITIHTIRDGDGAVVLDAAALGDVSHWAQPPASAARPVPALRGTPEGLVISVDSTVVADMRLSAAALPGPLPIAVTGPLRSPLLTATGGMELPVQVVATLGAVPRFGPQGALLDFDVAEYVLGRGTMLSQPEVWLSADAPADAVDRLRRAGLTVTGEYTVAQRRAQISAAPRLGLWFALAVAALTVLLAAVALPALAMFERPGGDSGLSVLGEQGIRTRTLLLVSAGSRCALALAAVVAGLGSAALAWALARTVLPVFSDGDTTFTPPVLPEPGAVAGPVAAAVAVLLAGCWTAAHVVRRRREEER